MWRWCWCGCPPPEEWQDTTEVWLAVLQKREATWRRERNGTAFNAQNFARQYCEGIGTTRQTRPESKQASKQASNHTPYLVSLPASDAHCRSRALSSLSALLSTPEADEDVDQEASLRGGRSLSDPMEAFRWCFLRPRRLLDREDGVAGLTRCASYAFEGMQGGRAARKKKHEV